MSDSDQIQRAKRKREVDAPLTKAEKRRKARAKRAKRQGGGNDHDEILGLNLGLGRMDSQMLVDYVAQRTKQFEPDLSPVELEDRYLSGGSFSCL
jgi:protein CMS1